MDCALIRSELVGYHFGTLSAETRFLVEEHLVLCTECLRAFMVLKSRLEAGGGGAEGRPSNAARQRLRSDVLREFGDGAKSRSRGAGWARLFQRPVPLYQGLVVAAVAVLVARAAPSLIERFVQRPSQPLAAEYVDTSRTLPSSLTIY